MNYQYIDLPNLKEISNQVLLRSPDLHKNTNIYKSYNREFFEDIEILVETIEKLKPWKEIFDIAIVSTKAKSKLPIHVDHGPITRHKYSLNIPVYNCDETYVVMYKKKNQNTKYYTTNLKDNHHYDEYLEDDMEVIDKFYLTKAALFNTQIPHRPINETSDPRIMLTIRFETAWDSTKVLN